MQSTKASDPRPDKVEKVGEIKGRLEASTAVLLTEYRGLPVSDMAQLRRSIRSVGGEYRVYKNTLVKFAARDLGLDALDSLLSGPTALAFIDGDVAQAAKVLRDFSRANPALVLKGGVLSGSAISAQDTLALADLPSREVLLARIAGAFQAPMQRMASLLQALPQNLAYGIQALIDSRGGPQTGSDLSSPQVADAPAEAEAPSAPAEEQ